jgi:predicted nucleotide-binding protein (sugar kinase/HSP70/actin superfamily)
MTDAAYALAAASRSCGVEAQVLPPQDEEDLRLARQHTSGKECFPMICTLGSFLKKMREPGFVPERSAFFMPDHGGPCRFGQYNKLDRIIFDELGYGGVEIVAPSNEDAYAGLSGGHGNRFRLAALRGIVATDLLRKLRQERAPYEATAGAVDRAYRWALERVVESVEHGARDIARVMGEIAGAFRAIRLLPVARRPVIAIVGEIFMRDNPFCSGHLVESLEGLGAETLMAPFKEWLTYSTLRYGRDSRWKADGLGILRAGIQAYFTRRVIRTLDGSVHGMVEGGRDIEVERMLDLCGPYVHRDYDGDPALALGASAALARTGISGVVNILPFTCLPGTLIAAVSGSFRRDHDNLPWVNVDFDGQEDTGLGTRLEAFVYQATEYARRRGYGTPRTWGPTATVVVPAAAGGNGRAHPVREVAPVAGEPN